MAPLVPAIFFYAFVQRFYSSSSRALRRLDSVTRSPLLANYAETLTGLVTIRAYGVQDRFLKEGRRMLDNNDRAFYVFLCMNRWLTLRLETMTAFLIFLVSVFAITQRHTLSAAIAGLVISYSLQISTTLNWFIDNIAQVRRYLAYCSPV